jgi:hypothetical protein
MERVQVEASVRYAPLEVRVRAGEMGLHPAELRSPCRAITVRCRQEIWYEGDNRNERGNGRDRDRGENETAHLTTPVGWALPYARVFQNVSICYAKAPVAGDGVARRSSLMKAARRGPI